MKDSNGITDKDVCAYDVDTGALLTDKTYSDELGSVLIAQMLQYSDNRTTDALTRRYGFSSLNGLAWLAGMSKTHLYHRIGCPDVSSPQPFHRNELTLRDAGRIYEQAEDGTLLDSIRRANLNGYLLGGPIATDGALAEMIEDEATALTAAERASFIAQVSTRSKGGGYSYCPATGSCDPGVHVDGTVGGVIWIPFKNGSGTVVSTPYVYGRFYNVDVPCTGAAISAGTCSALNNENAGNSTIAVEMFRQIIRQAIATW
jgi:hypothetical protein